MLSHLWIDSPSALDALLEQLASVDEVYLDTEFMRERTYRPQLALVQLYDNADHAWLVDPLACGSLNALGDWLSASPAIKVLHSCSEDLEAFQTGTGGVPAPVFDTQVAAAFCGYDLQLGYQRLVSEVAGVSLSKEATRSDWLKRPLTESQVHYAVQDVEFLPVLHQVLSRKLGENGRMSWFSEECDRLTRFNRIPPDPDVAWQEVKGAGQASDNGRVLLKAMAAWREELAQSRDIARSFIVPDRVLLVLAESPPKSHDDLRKAGMHHVAIRKYGADILSVVQNAGRMPVDPLPFTVLDATQKQLLKAMRQKVVTVSETAGLVPELLVRRRWMEQLVRSRGADVPEAMQGWRKEIITIPLLEMID